MTTSPAAITSAPARPAKHIRQLQLIIVLFAIILRLVFNTTAQWQPRSDTRDFHEYALSFLSGRGWVNYWMEHPTWNGFVIRQFHAPGYSVFLAAIYYVTGFDEEKYTRSMLSKAINGYYPWHAVGFTPRYVYLAQVGLEIISLILLGRIAARLFGLRASLLTQCIFALLVVWTPNLIAETLFNTLFISAAYLMVENADFSNRRRNILLALVLAAGISVKMIGIVPIMLMGLMSLWKPSFKKFVRVALIMIPTLLYLGGMAYRAYSLYGHPFIISTGGQHIAENTYGIDRTVEYVKMKAQLGRIPNEYETMTHYIQMTKQLIREQPGVAVRAYFKNLVDLCTLEPDWNTGWIWSVAWHDQPAIARLHRFLFSINYIIYPFGALGILMLWRRAPLIALLFLCFMTVHPAVSAGTYRYMAPAVCLLVPFAGGALDRLLTIHAMSKNLPAPGSAPTGQPRS